MKIGFIKIIKCGSLYIFVYLIKIRVTTKIGLKSFLVLDIGSFFSISIQKTV